MAEPRVAPYGEWRSPISAEMTAEGTLSLGSPCFAEDGIYWSERRASEGGRTVIVRLSDHGAVQDVTPAPFNARTRVHEYGGGAYLVYAGVVYFSNYSDQKLYKVSPGVAPKPVSRTEGMRYADGIADPHRGRLILVREDHTVGDQ